MTNIKQISCVLCGVVWCGFRLRSSPQPKNLLFWYLPSLPCLGGNSWRFNKTIYFTNIHVCLYTNTYNNTWAQVHNTYVLYFFCHPILIQNKYSNCKYISICFISTKKGWDLENVFWWKVLAENFGAGRHKEEEERRDSPAALGDHSTNLT